MKRLLYDTRHNLILILVIFGLWAGLNILFHKFCPFVLFCGFPCPGCGLSRAFWEFFTFHPIDAFRYNPSYPLWLGLIIAAVWRRYVRGKSLSVLKLPLGITAAVTIVIYIVRMKYDFPGEAPLVFEERNLLSVIQPAYDEFVKSHFL